MTTHPNGDAFTSAPLLTHEVGSLEHGAVERSEAI